MLVTKKKYKTLQAKYQSLQDDETVFMDKFRDLIAKGKTYAQISTILECDKQYLYAKARKYKLEVRKPWGNVSQYFTTMLTMHIEGRSYKAIGQHFHVSATRIHKIFANNGYTDFQTDRRHNTIEAQKLSDAFLKALQQERKG